MKSKSLGLGILFLTVLVWSGCDSGQKEQPTEAEPKTESTPMPAAEAPKAEESSKVEGALLATDGAAGAEENAEGVNHYQQGHWEVAQEHFNKALATNPDLPEAHYNLALALDKLGNHGEATNHFKAALDLAPEDPYIRDSGILKSHVGG
jgi:tetratricopeptide (TPR) repeat protein